jgi:hypothetical protein
LNWTTNSSANTGSDGYSSGGLSVFSNFGTIGCTATWLRLYCIGVDRAAAGSVDVGAPSAFRRAFVSSGAFVPGGGLSSADAMCANEATATGLPGTYRAALATGGASAQSRFDTSATSRPWYRVDNVRLAPSAAAFFSSLNWDAPLNLTGNGTHISNVGVWSGAPSGLNAAGTAASTCSSWTTGAAASTGVGGRAAFSNVAQATAMDPSIPCNATYYRVFCLQQ